MRIATWNINSVRLRIHHVLRFIKEQNIDVMCLQETKTPDEFFPLDQFIQEGINYSYFKGEKSYNGVAIISKLPLSKQFKLNWCGRHDARHISVSINDKITLHNFYVPAGGDLPDTKVNDKFKHKIMFIQEMIKYFKNDQITSKVLVGDLNIAPYENDVWSHKQLLDVVSHTPLETDNLKKLIRSGKWIDIIRKLNSYDDKIFSWWSYRNRDWKKSDRGRRLDHIWISEDLLPFVRETSIIKETRDWDKPSDHVPVLIELNI